MANEIHVLQEISNFETENFNFQSKSQKDHQNIACIDQPPYPEKTIPPGPHEDQQQHIVAENNENKSPLLLSQEKTILSQDDIFQNMHLRRILKENHGGDINQLVFFRRPVFFPQNKTEFIDEPSNLIATVGGAQANFYDNEHCGDHLDIMSHFSINGQGYVVSQPGSGYGADYEGMQELKTCCWINQDEDAVLAVAGTTKSIHILSLARSQEIQVLQGHSSEILDLQAHPKDPNIILSLSADGTSRLWHLPSGRCISVHQIPKGSINAIEPNGLYFVTGTSDGKVYSSNICTSVLGLSCEDVEKLVPLETDEKQLIHQSLHQGSKIDSLCFTKSLLLLSKSVNGKIILFDMAKSIANYTLMLRGATGSNSCRIDLSSDGEYFCVGNGSGVIFVFSLKTGRLIIELKHRRCCKAVRSCAFSRNMRSIVFGTEDSFVWRYDYISAEQKQKWTRGQD